MKFIFKILIIAILFAYGKNKCFAQEHTNRKAFISVNSGIYLPSVSGFKKTYHSPHAFVNGVSLGIPFTNKEFFFYAKAMYFQKSGTPIIYHFENNDGVVNTYTTQEGNVTYKQWLGNIGVQYNYSFRSNNILIFNGGISLAKASQSARTPLSNSDSVSEAKGVAGFFLGIGYEKKLLDKFSLFSEAQYNFDIPILKLCGVNMGGANFNLGIRYYFGQK